MPIFCLFFSVIPPYVYPLVINPELPDSRPELPNCRPELHPCRPELVSGPQDFETISSLTLEERG